MFVCIIGEYVFSMHFCFVKPEDTGYLVYHSIACSLETGSLTEPRAGVLASRTSYGPVSAPDHAEVIA